MLCAAFCLRLEKWFFVLQEQIFAIPGSVAWNMQRITSFRLLGTLWQHFKGIKCYKPVTGRSAMFAKQCDSSWRSPEREMLTGCLNQP